MNLTDLSFRDLAAARAVAEHRHFGRAAEALRIAQPTLTAQIQKIERSLGVRLFERSGRRFIVTPEGQRLMPIVRDLIAGAERLRSSAAETSDTSSPLRVGIIPTLAPYIMPYLLISNSTNPSSGVPAGRATLVRHRAALPAPAFDVTEQTTPSLVRALIDGTIDAALLSLPVRTESLDTVPLFVEPFLLIAPKGCELLSQSRLSPSRLCVRDMVLLDEGHCLRDQALAVCAKRRGTTPRLIATSLETLKYVVASSKGYSLIPRLASDLVPALRPLVGVRDFDERAPSRLIGLCFRHGASRRAEVQSLASHIKGRMPSTVKISE